MPSYLDYNSTAPLHPLAKAEMLKAMDIVGNPSSSHKMGLQARMVVDTARYSIAQLFKIRQEQVIFTSGGTESNNMVLKSFKNVLTSKLEHSSIVENCSNNFADLADLEEKLKSGEYDLVSATYVNSETGITQDIGAIAELCKRYNVVLHVDAVQAWGKLNLEFKNVNLMTLSAHKIGLAKGVGIILTDGKAELQTLIAGGGQERSRRSGTENVQALASLAVVEDVLNDMINISELRDYLEKQIKQINPKAIIVGEGKSRVGNTSYVISPGLDAQTQVINADMADVCISAGSACSSGKVKTSNVITALGYSEQLASCGVRLSIGSATTKQDIDKYLAAYEKLVERTS